MGLGDFTADSFGFQVVERRSVSSAAPLPSPPPPSLSSRLMRVLLLYSPLLSSYCFALGTAPSTIPSLGVSPIAGLAPYFPDQFPIVGTPRRIEPNMKITNILNAAQNLKVDS